MSIKYAGLIIQDTENSKILLLTYSNLGEAENTVFPDEPVKNSENPRLAALRAITDKLPPGVSIDNLPIDFNNKIVSQKQYTLSGERVTFLA